VGTNDPAIVVADAGPLIHLDEMGCVDLLGDFPKVLIPAEVWSEAMRHRPGLELSHVPTAAVPPTTPAPSARLVALADSLGLHAGERAALALVEEVATDLFLCVDTAARLAAESLSIRVHGTIGLLIRAIRRNLRTKDQVLELLKALPDRSTLHVSGKLLAKVVGEVERG
jgi:predicted nucleic acid-binding protein